MPKLKDTVFITTLLIICLLLLSNLFKFGVFSSHDGEIHIARIAQFEKALSEGQFPVRWLANLNFGFGYPTFVFLYSLPYYTATLISKLTESYEATFKVVIFLSLGLSAMSFYFVAKKLIAHKLAAFIGSIFYIAAPYRFADIYERGALGESLIFIFLPLLFIAPIMTNENTKIGFAFTSLVIFGALTTHAITFAIFIIPAILFSYLIFRKSISKFLFLLISILFGFLLASFQVLPVIFEQKYTELDKTYYTIFEKTFISANQLLRIPKEGINIGTGIQLGLAQSTIILLSTIFIIYDFHRERSFNKFTIFFLITSLGAAFLTLDVSKQIWFAFKPLQTILFPWRFLTFTTLTIAILASLLTKRLVNQKFGLAVVVLLLFLAIYPSRHYLKGYGWHSFPDEYYESYQDPLKIDNYYLPKGLTKNIENLTFAQISILKGSGQVKLIQKQNHKLEADLKIEEDAKIQLHTMHFPGWELFIDGKKSPIFINYPNLEGLVVASIPRGRHHLVLKFNQTRLRQTANYLTLAGFLILAFLIIKFRYVR